MNFDRQAIKYREGSFKNPKNNVRIHEHKILPHAYYAEVNTNCNFIEKQIVTEPENTYKVIYNGTTTIVILNDGSKGVSKCNSEDYYSTQKGHDIAHTRARIKQLEKKLDKLCK